MRFILFPIRKRQKAGLRGHLMTFMILSVSAILFTACFQQPVTLGPTGGPLSIELWVSGSCARPGDTIYARATMTNTSSELQFVAVEDRPVMDLEISSLAGKIRFSDTHSLTQLELKPQESKSIELQSKVETGVPLLGVTGTYITVSTEANEPQTLFTVVHVTDCPSIGP